MTVLRLNKVSKAFGGRATPDHLLMGELTGNTCTPAMLLARCRHWVRHICFQLLYMYA